MPTTQNVHGHDVLHLVQEASPALTRGELLVEATGRWGADARFCTCSIEGMTLEELLTFLMSRGKIVEVAGKLTTDISKICENGQAHRHD